MAFSVEFNQLSYISQYILAPKYFIFSINFGNDVLIESLSTGTPVISVNCESGPNEIVNHENNGLLVENFNIQNLSEAYNRFILEEDLYLHCKQNAIKSVNHLSVDTIAQQWTKYLKNELQ